MKRYDLYIVAQFQEKGIRQIWIGQFQSNNYNLIIFSQTDHVDMSITHSTTDAVVIKSCVFRADVQPHLSIKSRFVLTIEKRWCDGGNFATLWAQVLMGLRLNLEPGGLMRWWSHPPCYWPWTQPPSSPPRLHQGGCRPPNTPPLHPQTLKVEPGEVWGLGRSGSMSTVGEGIAGLCGSVPI